MNEVRTRNVRATKNPDGTWHVSYTKPDGTTLLCKSTPEALMLQAVETGNRQQPPPPEGSAFTWLLAVVLSPTALTALATSVFLFGRC